MALHVPICIVLSLQFGCLQQQLLSELLVHNSSLVTKASKCQHLCLCIVLDAREHLFTRLPRIHNKFTFPLCVFFSFSVSIPAICSFLFLINK